MNRRNYSEMLLLEEVTECAEEAYRIIRNLPIGAFVKMIRSQLGMSQVILAQRANVPQSTISRIEKGDKHTNLSTLKKVLAALSCELVLLPKLKEPIEKIRRDQAKKQAQKHIRYLKGTMSLEEQEPDSKLTERLLKQEEERLLQGPGSKLWGI